MSTPSAKVRLATTVFLAVILLVGVGAAAVRWALLPWAVGAALHAGGASDVKFAVERASPWRLQLSGLGFNFDAVKFAAGSASLERSHWWTPSLGRLSVQQARVEVNVDQLGASAPGGGSSPAGSGTTIPLEEISIDGQVVVHAGDQPDQSLALNFAARPVEEGTWQAEATLTAPGLEMGVEGSYRLAAGEGEFRSTALRLDLQTWQKWFEHWAPFPGGPWDLAGTLTGETAGEYVGGKFAARGEFHLRDARASSVPLKVAAEGISADIDVADLTQMLARKATLQAKTVTSGAIVFSDVAAEFSRTEGDRFDIAALSARALGGKLSVEPFAYRLGQTGVEAVILADGIRAEEVMALTEDLPARASGPLSGRLPVRYDGSGLRLGTGWLGLKEGGSVEIQFHAAGLLTAGTSPKSPQYAVLKKVEDGILKLKVTELRLDIRPPNAPGTRTAQLHVVGAPVDPEVKAPVTLDLNVNGPIESLINLGMKSGASFGK